jgi:CRISPR-associated endonuclease/helicase Cas3
MYGRVREFLARRAPAHPANLVLAHGGAWEQPRYAPSAVHGEEAAGSGDAAATEWFLPKKRALLAPYGVGTVDQALMAVLQVRHVFVRLFGLAGKPVVIDEVHAYDTYMTGLLERLLEWLGALGSPVVLLSATLPSGRREQLLAAYSRGMGSTAEPPPVPPYPRVTWVGASASGAEHAEPSERSVRSLAIERVEDSTEALSSALAQALQGGGCAAVICNTVARAQEVYRELSVSFEPGTELGLFHARFLEKDRRSIEEECLRRFGPPNASTERPSRFVLVATQVIEQSLDVDFDVMFTEFAPVDLLLQRAGRLQRHDRGPRTPVLRILWPGTDEGGLPRFQDGTRAVYEKHILLRTWHALRERPAIAIPGDVQELVDLVYRDDEAVPAGADAALATRWHNTWKEMAADRDREEDEAKTRRLGSPLAERSIERFLTDPREEDEDLHPALQALTRLAEPSFNVVLAPAGYELPAEPGEKDVRFLLERSVSVSHRGLVPVLRELQPPVAFQKRAALRRHRLVVLEGSGSATVGRWRLTYSSETGLEVEVADG